MARPAGPAADHRSHGNTAVLLGVLSLAGIVLSMQPSLVAPALPVIARDFKASTADISWIVTSYLLAAAVATPILGRLGDMFGKRRILLVVQVLLAAGCLIAALASSLSVIIVGRVLQGAASGLPLLIGIVRDELPAERVDVAVGVVSAIFGVGGVLGIVLAGPIVDNLGWHWLFWIPLLVVALSTTGIALHVPPSSLSAAGRVDLPGAALLSTGLACLLLAVTKGNAWGWTAASTLGLFAGATSALTVWVLVERRVPEPLVDMHMMARLGVWTTNLSGLAFGFAMFGIFLLIPLLVELPTATGYGLGQSATIAGLYLLPAGVAMAVLAPLSGVLSRHFGPRMPLTAGTVLATTALTVAAIGHHHTWQLLSELALMGAGLGLALAAMGNAIVDAVPQTQTSLATGVNTISRYIGGSIGTAVLASILSSTTTHGMPTNNGFTYGFAVAAAVLVISLVPCLRRQRPAPTQHTALKQ